jgi:hypothetical protein
MLKTEVVVTSRKGRQKRYPLKNFSEIFTHSNRSVIAGITEKVAKVPQPQLNSSLLESSESSSKSSND